MVISTGSPFGALATGVWWSYWPLRVEYSIKASASFSRMIFAMMEWAVGAPMIVFPFGILWERPLAGYMTQRKGINK